MHDINSWDYAAINTVDIMEAIKKIGEYSGEFKDVRLSKICEYFPFKI